MPLEFHAHHAGDGGATLSVLTALTQLQQLHTPSIDAAVVTSPADVAAMTASQQLTYLGLSLGVGPDCAPDLFPEHSVLPNIRALSFEASWLQGADTMQRVVSACPGLQHLSFASCWGPDIDAGPASHWAAGLAALASLTDFTHLKIISVDISMTEEVFLAIARLLHLRELVLAGLCATVLGPAVQLAACRQLTRLQINATDNVTISATNQVRCTTTGANPVVGAVCSQHHL